MARTNPRGRLVFPLLLCQLLLPFFVLPLQAAVPSERKEDNAVTLKAKAAYQGVATYYAKKYNGRKTNSGERYDPRKLTAAHPNLPLGTMVKVVNLKNDREVIVRVNDRCKKRKVPFIDLSRSAAEELGFFGQGLTKVKIIPLVDVAGEQ